VVNLNRMVDWGQWGFVTPSYTATPTSTARLDNSAFSVLCMTESAPAKPLGASQCRSDSAQSIAGFLVRRNALYDLVHPAIMVAYPGLTEQNFVMNKEGPTFLTRERKCRCRQKATSRLINRCHRLSVKSNGRTHAASYSETPIVGITATCATTHWYPGAGDIGKGQTIAFQNTAERTSCTT
jgi:hypothetical protein